MCVHHSLDVSLSWVMAYYVDSLKTLSSYPFFYSSHSNKICSLKVSLSSLSLCIEPTSVFSTLPPQSPFFLACNCPLAFTLWHNSGLLGVSWTIELVWEPVQTIAHYPYAVWVLPCVCVCASITEATKWDPCTGKCMCHCCVFVL